MSSASRSTGEPSSFAYRSTPIISKTRASKLGPQLALAVVNPQKERRLVGQTTDFPVGALTVRGRETTIVDVGTRSWAVAHFEPRQLSGRLGHVRMIAAMDVTDIERHRPAQPALRARGTRRRRGPLGRRRIAARLGHVERAQASERGAQASRRARLRSRRARTNRRRARGSRDRLQPDGRRAQGARQAANDVRQIHDRGGHGPPPGGQGGAGRRDAPRHHPLQRHPQLHEHQRERWTRRTLVGLLNEYFTEMVEHRDGRRRRRRQVHRRRHHGGLRRPRARSQATR